MTLFQPGKENVTEAMEVSIPLGFDQGHCNERRDSGILYRGWKH